MTAAAAGLRRRRIRMAGVTVAGLAMAWPLFAGAAEVPVGRWGLGLDAGVMKLQEGTWDYSAADQFGRLRLARGLSRHWSLQAAWLLGHVRCGVDERGASAGWTFHSEPPYRTLLSQPMLEIEHRLSPGAFISPTLTAGVGLTRWRVIRIATETADWFPSGDTVTGFDLDGNQVELSGTDLTFGFGVGFEMTLSDQWRLAGGARYQVLQGNDRDNVGLSALWGPEHVDANTALTGAWAGLTWWPGASDRDGDGVADRDDGCPDDPEDRDRFNDRDGCPDPDNDDDGVADTDDLCPQLAEDQDGFEDADGCPDLDNDGDGVPDARDRCPDSAEDLDGDADSDGCPETPAQTAPQATPELPRGTTAPSASAGTPRPAVPADFVLDGVAFASGSAVLTADARAQLEDAAAWLATEAGQVEIRGHTDAAGQAEANRALSLRRAEAVRRAFIEMGLPAARLNATGAGEDEPVAGNATPEDRARNRRVEIRLLR